MQALFFNVSESAIHLVVSPASVNVDITVYLADTSTALSTIQTISPASLTTVLEVPILAVSSPRIIQLTPLNAPPQPPVASDGVFIPPSAPITLDGSGSNLIFVIAGLTGVAVLFMVVYLFPQRRKSDRPLMHKHPVYGTPSSCSDVA